MTNSPRYETPFHWWGPGAAPTTAISLAELVRSGVVSLDDAAMLTAAVAQRRSLIVISGASGLGKSTLLHTLLPWLPEDTRRIYLRGCYESFAFRDDPRFPPGRSVMLANEISPHLPFYLWGAAVQRALELRERGYPLLATAHGQSVVGFVASLTGSPLRIPARLVAGCDLVVLLESDPVHNKGSVTAIWQLSSSARDGVALDRVTPDELPAGVDRETVAAVRMALAAQSGPGRPTDVP